MCIKKDNNDTVDGSMIISQTDSLLYQSTTMCNLLVEMNENNFLQSDDYKDNYFKHGAEYSIEVLRESGLGNPAALQMMLYILLVVPKEIFEREDNQICDTIKNVVNNFCSTCAFDVYTDYDKEQTSNYSTINFFRHIRNAISHSRCEYFDKANIKVIKFEDENVHKNSSFEASFYTCQMGVLVFKVLEKLNEYLNNKHKQI